MNFFRKQDQVLLTLSSNEIEKGGESLRKDLKGLFPVPDGSKVRVSIHEAKELPLESLAILLSFAASARESGATISFIGSPEVVEHMERLDFGKSLASLEKGGE